MNTISLFTLTHGPRAGLLRATAMVDGRTIAPDHEGSPHEAAALVRRAIKTLGIDDEFVRLNPAALAALAASEVAQ